MNGLPLCPIALALTVVTGLLAGKDPGAGLERYQVNVSVRQGDLHGSLEAGTLKILAEATLIAQANQEATYISGGELAVDGEFLEFGNKLRVTPEPAVEAVRLKLCIERTAVLQSGDDSTRLRTDRALYTKTVKPGEIIRLDWGAPSERTWIELNVRELAD